jgi:hypothetical protein
VSPIFSHRRSLAHKYQCLVYPARVPSISEECAQWLDLNGRSWHTQAELRDRFQRSNSSTAEALSEKPKMRETSRGRGERSGSKREHMFGESEGRQDTSAAPIKSLLPFLPPPATRRNHHHRQPRLDQRRRAASANDSFRRSGAAMPRCPCHCCCCCVCARVCLNTLYTIRYPTIACFRVQRSMPGSNIPSSGRGK